MTTMQFEIFNSKAQWNVSREDEIVICQAYALMNGMRNGTTTKKDCKALMASLGFNIYTEELKKLVQKMTDVDSVAPIIPFTDFFAIIKAKIWERKVNEEMRQVFQLFDINKRGYITYESILQLLAVLDEEMKEIELKDMIDAMDSNKKGRITEDDFVNFLRKTKFWYRQDERKL